MKKWFWSVLVGMMLVGSVTGWSQTVPKETPKAVVSTDPALSTADKIAIGQCEKAKQDAQKMFNDAMQQELSVLREWEAGHPGWRVNPMTFVVEKVEVKK
jgi:hypothetical protein